MRRIHYRGSTYWLLDAPLTPQEMRARADKDNYVKGIVAAELAEIVSDRTDYEGFPDILAERLTGSILLTDISYRIVGHVDNMLHLEVCGSIDEIEHGWPDELRWHETGCPAQDGMPCRCGEPK